MANAATMARDNAIHCEAKKHAYRQTQDGVVVSFVLHPQEVPEGLATAPLGSRYVMALVQIGDDELPKVNGGETRGRSSLAPQDRSEPITPTAGPPQKEKRRFDELGPAQQAGILCNEIAFRRFLAGSYDGIAVLDLDMAADHVREHCGVLSRSEIGKHPTATARWHDLIADYRAWQRAPEVTG